MRLTIWAAAILTLTPPAVTPLALGAQPADTTKISHDPLFTRRDLYVAAGFAAVTVLLTPLDERAAGRLRDLSERENRLFHKSASFFRFMGEPGPLIIGGSLYAVGRVGGFKRVADLGLHGTEALYVGMLVGNTIKGLAGRARPYVVSDTNARDFAFWRGFREGGDYRSFPSGHTTAAFAAAAAVTSETSRWWPSSTWYVAPIMYGGAALVGISRMYHNKHWATDVGMGAAIGTFSGLKVVRYHHSHPDNRIDRWLLGSTIMPDGYGGVMLAYRVPVR